MYHRERRSTQPSVASQASWKNKIPTSSTVEHHKNKTSTFKVNLKQSEFYKKLFCPRDQERNQHAEGQCNKVLGIKGYSLPTGQQYELPSCEGIIHIKFWHRQSLLLCYE